jgi:hypothetical protein
MNKRKFGLIGFVLGFSALSMAGTLTVTAPTAGKFLGERNTLTFNGRDARVQVTVQAVITGPTGSTTLSTQVTPDADGKFSGSLALNFSQTAFQGDYTIVVSATEPNASYTPTNLNVKVDTRTPRLLDYRPAQNSFVKGVVPIVFQLLEANMKEWRITVGGADIPNNSGTTETSFNVNYDTTTVEIDGAQNIALAVKDLADNPLNFSIPVTVDRKAPIVNVQFPRNDTPIRRRSDVNVIIDVADQFGNAVDLTGVDVVVQRTDGTFISRVARQSWVDSGNNTWRWKGRLRYRTSLPNEYILVVSAIDKAGNVATRQQVIIRPGA